MLTPWCSNACSRRSHASFARASISACGTVTLAAAAAASRTASRNSRSTACWSASSSRVRRSSRSSSSVSSPAASSAKSSLSSGSTFSRTSVTETVEDGVLRRELGVRVIVGEADLDPALVAGARAEESLVEAWKQASCAQLDELRARLAPLDRHARDLAAVVDDEVVAGRARRARPVRAGRAARGPCRAGRRSARRSTAGSRRAASTPRHSASVARRPHADLEAERVGLALTRQLAELRATGRRRGRSGSS